MAGSLSLLVHASALILIYSIYSLLQEKIMKSTYSAEQEHFTSAALLVLTNRIFSIITGFVFTLVLPSRDDLIEPEHKFRPSWPLLSYAIVAAANFSSTYCQYDALKYVGFTTQALAKCAKMVPVLIIGRIIYKKSYKEKEYVAGATVVFGCFLYLNSRPTSANVSHKTISDNPYAPLIGMALLGAYLFFDGLTSTTQEHYFGKAKKDVHPLSAGSPVLDQMIWVNLMAAVISVVLCLASYESTFHSFRLLLKDSALLLDIVLLSATATFGLIVLYDTIFQHGALTVATTMTLRQFFSIVLNAGIFGNLHSIGFYGWLGVAYVAAGIYVKMDKRFDPPKQLGAAAKTTQPLLPTDKLGAPSSQLALPETLELSVGDKCRKASLQYGLPLALPMLVALVMSMLQ